MIDKKEDRHKKMITGMWYKACMGYNEQRVDPAVLEEFAVLLAKKCLSLNAEVIEEMKTDAIDMPGAGSLMNIVRVECRNRIIDEFNIQ